MRIIPKTENYETVAVSIATKRREEDEKWFKRSEKPVYGYDLDEDNAKVVCVTDGLTFLGRAIVKRLLLHGYTVRVIVNVPGNINSVK